MPVKKKKVKNHAEYIFSSFLNSGIAITISKKLDEYVNSLLMFHIF